MGRMIDEDEVLAIINRHYVLGQGILNSTLDAIEEKIMQLLPDYDSISRRGAIDRIERTYSSLAYQEDGFNRQDAIDILKRMPPKQKTGEWIFWDDDPDANTYECPECHEPFTLIEGTPAENEYNFCPKCGARLIEGEGK